MLVRSAVRYVASLRYLSTYSSITTLHIRTYMLDSGLSVPGSEVQDPISRNEKSPFLPPTSDPNGGLHSAGTLQYESGE